MCRLTHGQRFGSKTDKFRTVPRNHLHHLARRFVFTLRARAPQQDEVDWVRQQLSDREFELWVQMSSADRLHSVAVANRVFKELPGDEMALTAGLLHDVGKVAVRSGIVTRVVAAIAKPMINPERLEWLASRGSFSPTSDRFSITRVLELSYFEMPGVMNLWFDGQPSITYEKINGQWMRVEGKHSCERTLWQCKKVVWNRQR